MTSVLAVSFVIDNTFYLLRILCLIQSMCASYPVLRTRLSLLQTLCIRESRIEPHY